MEKNEKNKTDIIRIIREKRSELVRRFTVLRIGLFGSFAIEIARTYF
jgi:predicted nucleotidyltransferase